MERNDELEGGFLELPLQGFQVAPEDADWRSQFVGQVRSCLASSSVSSSLAAIALKARASSISSSDSTGTR